MTLHFWHVGTKLAHMSSYEDVLVACVTTHTTNVLPIWATRNIGINVYQEAETRVPLILLSWMSLEQNYTVVDDDGSGRREQRHERTVKLKPRGVPGEMPNAAQWRRLETMFSCMTSELPGAWRDATSEAGSCLPRPS